MSRKTDYWFVRETFEAMGYTLLSGTYENSHKHLECMCPKGHKVKIAWLAFKNGVRCAKCCGNAKFTYEEVRDYFAEHSCELLEREYKNSVTPITYRCRCGNISKIRFGDFRQGKRCCGKHDNSGANHPRWNPDKKINQQLADKVHGALKTTLKYLGRKKNCKSKELLGYGLQELRCRLECHPNWERVKDKKWSIDHIYPIKAFIDHNITDIKLINCLENLQPMLMKDNSAKNDKYDEEEFVKWLKDRT